MKPVCFVLVATFVVARAEVTHADTPLAQLSPGAMGGELSVPRTITPPVPSGLLVGNSPDEEVLRRVLGVIVGLLSPDPVTSRGPGSKPSLRITPARIANEGYGLSASVAF
jgi:hypothetical protein